MQSQDARTVRGLSIATVILAALGLVLWSVNILLLIFTGAALTNPLFADWVDSNGSYYSSNGYYSDYSSAVPFVGLSMGAVVLFLMPGIAFSIVTLIAGIKGMQNYDKPETYGNCFGWAIAGAITSFLSGGIIATILLGISAGLISRMRTRNPFIAQPGAPVGAGPVNATYQSYERPGMHVTPDAPYTQATPQPQPQPGYVAPAPQGYAPQPGYAQPAPAPAPQPGYAQPAQAPAPAPAPQPGVYPQPAPAGYAAAPAQPAQPMPAPGSAPVGYTAPPAQPGYAPAPQPAQAPTPFSQAAPASAPIPVAGVTQPPAAEAPAACPAPAAAAPADVPTPDAAATEPDPQVTPASEASDGESSESKRD